MSSSVWANRVTSSENRVWFHPRTPWMSCSISCLLPTDEQGSPDNEVPGTVPYQIQLQMFLTSFGRRAHCAVETFIFKQIS